MTTPTFKHLSVVTLNMGLGHLRAALPLSQKWNLPLIEADSPEVSTEKEQWEWKEVRVWYERVSRGSQLPVIGWVADPFLEKATALSELFSSPPMPAPHFGNRQFQKRYARGMGRTLAKQLLERDDALISTFYAPPAAVEFHGHRKNFCVVTDSDIHRIWAPHDSATSSTVFLTPTRMAGQRLLSYGVRPQCIVQTGFPLPHELVGDGQVALKANLARRLGSLDPRGTFRAAFGPELQSHLGELPRAEPGPVHLAMAIGGAGAQLPLALRLLEVLAPALRDGRFRLSLVAGLRAQVANAFHEAIAALDLPSHSASVVWAPAFADYYAAFNALLAQADLLWTKPSELSFYAGLGLPLVFAPPVGSHEGRNQLWVQSNGAGLPQPEPASLVGWLEHHLEEGTLAHAAWCGYRRIPSDGLYRIEAELRARLEQASE